MPLIEPSAKRERNKILWKSLEIIKTLFMAPRKIRCIIRFVYAHKSYVLRSFSIFHFIIIHSHCKTNIYHGNYLFIINFFFRCSLSHYIHVMKSAPQSVWCSIIQFVADVTKSSKVTENDRICDHHTKRNDTKSNKT